METAAAAAWLVAGAAVAGLVGINLGIDVFRVTSSNFVASLVETEAFLEPEDKPGGLSQLGSRDVGLTRASIQSLHLPVES